jgi:hypothetical protein
MKHSISSHARPLLAVALMAMFGVAAAQTSGTAGSTGTAGSPPGATGSPKMDTSTTGTTGARSGAGTSAMGSSAGSSDSAEFRSLDKSNRGYLQRNDVTGISGFSFDQADLNHDGRISQDEFAQWQSHNSRAGGAMGQGSGSTSNSGMTNRSGTTYPSTSGATTNPGMSNGQGTTGTTK